MQMFDEFILAVETETKLKFYKDEGEEEKNSYYTNVSFQENTTQKIFVSIKKDETGDLCMQFFSKVCKLEDSSYEYLKNILEINTNISYGALCLKNSNIIFCYSYYVQDLDPKEFIKILYYAAAKADELEEKLQK